MNNSNTFQKEIKRFYVSGKISGIKLEWAKKNFHFACLEVQKYHGADFVVNPFDIKPFLGFKCWGCYMLKDLLALRKCTHIALMSNWIDSKGACIEHFIGKFILKLEVIYL